MMKKLLHRIIYFLYTCPFLFSIFQVSAQSPGAINYQAVARDGSGNPIANTAIYVEFKIWKTDPTIIGGGSVVYDETHSVTTNAYGLFNLIIASGSIVSGNFPTIPWGSDLHFLEVLVDPDAAGGLPYVSMGATQFISVPYALHSTTADSLLNPPAGSFIWKRTADSVYLNTLTNRVGIGTNAPTGKLSVLVPSGSMDGFNVAHQGTGHAGVFAQNNPANDSATIVSYTNGTGEAVFGINIGTGHGGVFAVNNSSSYGIGLVGSSNGNGKAIFGYQTGLGYGGAFWINNVANDSAAVIGLTYGNGPAVQGIAGGNGKAGLFQIANPLNTDTALYVTTNGSGNAGVFQITNAGNTSSALYATTNNPAGLAGEFVGRVKIFDGTQGANKVLTSDVSGNASWQSLPTSLTGTGTATQVAFWSGAASLSSNSNLFWDNTNFRLGIGTSSPSYPLHVTTGGTTDAMMVVNTYTTSRAATFSISNVGNASAAVYATTSGSGSAGYFNAIGTANAVMGYTTGTRRAGDFTIANASNNYPALDATTNGAPGGTAINATNSGTGKAGQFQITNAANTSDALYSTTNGAANSKAVYGKHTGTGIVYGVFGEATGSGGSVGVYGYASNAAGTNNYGVAGFNQNPSSGYGVFGQGLYGVYGQTNNASGYGVYGIANTAGSTAVAGFSNTNSGRAGHFEITGATNASSALYVSTAGTGLAGEFVGKIKTTKFQMTNGPVVIGDVLVSADAIGNAQWQTPSASLFGGWSLTGNALTGTEWLGSSTAQPLVFRTGNTERMRIDASGSVGIGVSPSYPFHVQKSAASVFVASIENTNATGYGLEVRTTSTSSSQNAFEIYTGGTSRFLVRSDGYAGIGTIAPEALLHIKKNDVATIYPLQLGNTNQPTREWLFDVDGTANMYVRNEGGGTPFTSMFFDNGGNVGIGVFPTTKLDVAGNIRFSNALMPNGSAGAGGDVLTSQGAGVAPTWQTPPITGALGGGMPAGAFGNTLRFGAGTWVADNTIYNDGTNVGIGTTLPSSKLHTVLTTTASVNGIRIDYTNTAAAAGNRGGLFITHSATHPAGGIASHGIFINSTNSGIGSAIGLGAYILGNTGEKRGLDISASGAGTNVGMLVDASGGTTNTGGYFSASGGATNYAIIVPSTGGNVGIGTTAPAAKLDVAGNVKIADGTEAVGKVLTSDNVGVASWQSPAFTNAAVFNTSGNFTVPAGVTKILVEVWGAGGGGGVNAVDNGGGGGGGAYAKDFLSVVPAAVIPVTVGIGGVGAGAGGGLGGGGTSSSISTITANGGAGGATSAGGAGGAAGAALITVAGGGGYNGLNVATTFPHGGDAGVGGTGGRFLSTIAGGSNGVAPGGGGSGANGGFSGGTGANGRVIVWW